MATSAVGKWHTESDISETTQLTIASLCSIVVHVSKNHLVFLALGIVIILEESIDEILFEYHIHNEIKNVYATSWNYFQSLLELKYSHKLFR